MSPQDRCPSAFLCSRRPSPPSVTTLVRPAASPGHQRLLGQHPLCRPCVPVLVTGAGAQEALGRYSAYEFPL